jgi:hypothetical protein
MVLDRVAAVVNGDLIFDSDVDDERRFGAMQPFRDTVETPTRDQLIERIIDRTLILQQARLESLPPIEDAQLDAELAGLRKSIPACANNRCETDAGWQKFVEAQGFTVDEVRERWRQRMEVLRFIEARFRMGTRILPEEIDEYYQKTLLPAYRAQNVVAPPEPAVSDRIQEILLQRQVNKLLADWLQSLRAQGSVRIVKPGETMP